MLRLCHQQSDFVTSGYTRTIYQSNFLVKQEIKKILKFFFISVDRLFFKSYTLHIPCYSCMQKNKPIGFLYHSKTVKKIALQKKEQGHFAPFFLNKYKYMYMRTKWNKCSKISAVYRLIACDFWDFILTAFLAFFDKNTYFLMIFMFGTNGTNEFLFQFDFICSIMFNLYCASSNLITFVSI